MPTVKEVMDVYKNNPAIRSAIDAALGLQPEQFSLVEIEMRDKTRSFPRVTELTNLTNFKLLAEDTFRINHHSAISDELIQTEITGVLKFKSKKLGEVKK